MCGVCAPVCCTSVCVCVCVYVSIWSVSSQLSGGTRQPAIQRAVVHRGSPRQRARTWKGFADKSAFLLGLHRHQQAEERRRDFGRKKKVLGKRQGGGLTQGTCHAHQYADMRGECEVGTCQVSTWREAPKTGRRGSLCFEQSLSPCTYNAPESK